MPEDRKDYAVGYAKPPKAHQLPKGKSGNPKGRPKSKTSASAAITALLNEAIKVKLGGKKRNMSPFEAGLRKIAKKAVDGDLPSILKFIKTYEEYRVIAPPPAERGGGVVTAPEGVDLHE